MGLDARPKPPPELFDTELMFTASSGLEEWARATFIAEGSSLENPEHFHLNAASIGFLWTNVGNARHGKSIVGTCELGKPMAMGKWPKARAEMQVRHWFGDIPDFIITLQADYAAQCGDAEFCALVEHELYHAGQERDVFGQPKFRRSGLPAFAMRGHDVEEFTGIVRRYGVGAGAGDTLAFVQAAQQAPEIATLNISHACGVCLNA